MTINPIYREIFPVVRLGIGWFRDSAFGFGALDGVPDMERAVLSCAAMRWDPPWPDNCTCGEPGAYHGRHHDYCCGGSMCCPYAEE